MFLDIQLNKSQRAKIANYLRYTSEITSMLRDVSMEREGHHEHCEFEDALDALDDCAEFIREFLGELK